MSLFVDSGFHGETRSHGHSILILQRDLTVSKALQEQGFPQHSAEDEVLSPSPNRSEPCLFMKTPPPPLFLLPWAFHQFILSPENQVSPCFPHAHASLVDCAESMQNK